ncbi:MAG TPA: hypothetical protein VGL57_02380 [Solirubrobacteraceae bacterium]|jgi:hypothetical protein
MRNAARKGTRQVGLAIAALAAMLLLVTATATAAPLPNRFLLTSQFGQEVNQTSGAGICTVASGNVCQRGSEGGEAGGFEYPEGVAVDQDPTSPHYGDVYVADTSNHRVEEFSAAGQFLSTFGWDVNETEAEAGAPQSERNVCSAASNDVCQAGVYGSAVEQFGQDSSIAIDQASGEVYVTDYVFGESSGELGYAERVQKFDADGQFIWELGKEVNESTKGNLCTAEEMQHGAKCGAAALIPDAAGPSSEHAAFSFRHAGGNLLVVGGPQDLLYVADLGRIQEFKVSGEWAGEISLAELAAGEEANAVAVDSTGDVFVAAGMTAGVHEYDASGRLQAQVIDPTALAPPEEPGAVPVSGLAIDPNGRLGVIEYKEVHENGGRAVSVFGRLYTTSGRPISRFGLPSASPPETLPGRPSGLAFAASDELYVAATGELEIDAYEPIVFAEMATCAATAVTATSAQLCGEINPDGVPTVGFFQYGPSSGLQTQQAPARTPEVFSGSGESFVLVGANVTGLTPNQAYRYELVAEASGNGEELQGRSEEAEFHTPVVPPQVPGAPSASFVTSQNALLSASLNPEHTNTRYHFEYGPCATLVGCTTVQSTANEESSQYGVVGSTQEITGLQPLTTYSYRFTASNEFQEGGSPRGGRADGAEGTFRTGAAPSVQAVTGAASALTQTSAVVAGTVNADGQSAIYTFELGVYAGAETQYGIVFSASAGAEASPVGESLSLSGLQPGATYAYRIGIHGGYGSALGASATFTTAGLPAVLPATPSSALLAVPAVALPKAVALARTKPLTRAQKLAAALRVCRRDSGKAKRASCERQAHKRYAPRRARGSRSTTAAHGLH